MEISETALLQLSKAKDGDVLMLHTDEPVWSQEVIKFFHQLQEFTDKKIALVVVPTGESLQLLEASEARAILEKLAAGS